MKMSFRWYGESDPISLEYIRQIPNMSSVVSAVYDVKPGEVWPEESLEKMKSQVEANGMLFDIVESVPVPEEIKLGTEKAEELTEVYCENIRRCAKYGIKCITYNFMPVFDWTRTQLDKELFDGSNALVYYKDQLDQYRLADDKYVFTNGTPMYRVNELTIINTGTADNLRTYARWDNDLIQSTDDINFFFNPTTGHGVQLGHKFISAAWKELPGFARNLNTIHGWIIRLNRLFNNEDIRTRDMSTMQGCINTMHDIIAKFDNLIPSSILGVNRFGQIETMTTTTNS